MLPHIFAGINVPQIDENSPTFDEWPPRNVAHSQQKFPKLDTPMLLPGDWPLRAPAVSGQSGERRSKSEEKGIELRNSRCCHQRREFHLKPTV